MFNSVFSTIAGIFTPLLPALAGSGILRGLLTLAEQAGLISVESGTYGILSTASLAVFNVLPIELAFTSALKFKTNPYIAVLFGGTIGGAYMGANQVIANAFVFGGLTTIPAFVGETLGHYLIGLLICFPGSAVATIILGVNQEILQT